MLGVCANQASHIYSQTQLWLSVCRSRTLQVTLTTSLQEYLPASLTKSATSVSWLLSPPIRRQHSKVVAMPWPHNFQTRTLHPINTCRTCASARSAMTFSQSNMEYALSHHNQCWHSMRPLSGWCFRVVQSTVTPWIEWTCKLKETAVLVATVTPMGCGNKLCRCNSTIHSGLRYSRHRLINAWQEL